MWAMVYVLILFYMLPKIKDNTWFRCVFIIIPLFTVPLLSKYFFLFSVTPCSADSYRNSIIPVIAYFLVGVIIREKREIITGLSLKYRTGIVVCSVVGLLLERTILLLLQNTDEKSGSYFFTAILAVSVFCLFLDLGTVQHTHSLAVFGRKYSLNFYIIHQVFVKIETKIFDVNTPWQYVGVAFVTCSAVTTVIIWDKLKTAIKGEKYEFKEKNKK